MKILEAKKCLLQRNFPVAKAFESLRGRYYQQARISQTGNMLIAELLLGSSTGAPVRKAGSSHRSSWCYIIARTDDTHFRRLISLPLKPY
jgi:hypothetical protein